MPRNSYLRCTAGRFVFRRRVPADLVDRLGRRELVRRLPPCDHKQARSWARFLSSSADDLFRMAADPTVSDSTLKQLARDWFRHRVAERESIYLSRVTPMDHDDVAAIVSRFEDQALHVDEAIRLNLWQRMKGHADEVLTQGGEAVPASPDTYRSLGRMLMRADAAAWRIIANRAKGDFSDPATDPLFAGAIDEVAAPLPMPPPERTASQPQRSSQSELFSVMLDRYIQREKVARGWREQTVKQAKATGRLVVEFLGDRGVSSYSRQEFSGLVDKLAQVPANYGRGGKEYHGLRISEAVAKADASNTPVARLAPKTVFRHVTVISNFWAWLKDQGHVSGDNPVSGVYRKPKRERKRFPWTQDQLNAWFSSPVYAGSLSASRRMDRGSTITKDWVYWLPLLAAYSGARLGELAPLLTADIIEVDGIPLINIAPDEANRKLLKSEAARRRVPISSVVVQAGFLDYVAERRKAGDKRLFPTLRPGGVDTIYSFLPSKTFPRHFKTAGLQEVSSTKAQFHGLRHTAQQAMRHAGVSDSLIKTICGHDQRADMTFHYAGEHSLKQMWDAIELVRYGTRFEKRVLGSTIP
jgi:integrase